MKYPKTVEELIEILKTFPPQAGLELCLDDWDDYAVCKSIWYYPKTNSVRFER